MKRERFLKICGLSCIGIIGMSGIIHSCSTAHYINSTIKEGQLQILKKEFKIIKDNSISYRNYIIVNVENIKYPIVVYRKNDDKYSAILLKCSHQGAELSVSGDVLTCSAHGSEFDNNGKVLQGPAESQLTTFKIQIDLQNIYIQLT
ncbi:MAG: cytochrome b6-f complex iron-sulfur subunit [Flavobacterium sp.]|jgi:cytochrome b6-f complex iron-sulfur subunit